VRLKPRRQDANSLRSIAAPWRNTSGGPSPLRQQAVGVPSFESTVSTVAATILAIASANRQADGGEVREPT
jgi:hypothetical protein